MALLIKLVALSSSLSNLTKYLWLAWHDYCWAQIIDKCVSLMEGRDHCDSELNEEELKKVRLHEETMPQPLKANTYLCFPSSRSKVWWLVQLLLLSMTARYVPVET